MLTLTVEANLHQGDYATLVQKVTILASWVDEVVVNTTGVGYVIAERLEEAGIGIRRHNPAAVGAR